MFLGFISFIVRPLFIEWQRFASSSLGLLMLKHLDENEQRWRSFADEKSSHSITEQARDGCSDVSSASVEVKVVCSSAEPSLPVVLHKEVESTRDASSSAERDHCAAECSECSADCAESPDCCTTRLESRRGSLPTCDTVPLISAGRRRNSAPVISHCAAITVKKYLLATLAEHSSSFCTRNSSCESEHLFSSSNHACHDLDTADSKSVDHSDVGLVKHLVMEPHHVLYHGAKRSSWTAVAPLNAGSTCVGIEGRPRDRRSNSHALVFRHCLFAGRMTGRRFSSPAVGQDHWMNRDSESVPLLSPVIPSSTVCSHPALVNWFVVSVVL